MVSVRLVPEEVHRISRICELRLLVSNCLSAPYGGVIKRTGTGELPLTGFPGGVDPLPQAATFNTVTLSFPF